MKCSVCNNPVDLRNDWTLEAIEGWQRRRKGGGLNHLLFPHKTGKVMCAECALRRRYTGEQMSLLEGA